MTQQSYQKIGLFNFTRYIYNLQLSFRQQFYFVLSFFYLIIGEHRDWTVNSRCCVQGNGHRTCRSWIIILLKTGLRSHQVGFREFARSHGLRRGKLFCFLENVMGMKTLNRLIKRDSLVVVDALTKMHRLISTDKV